MYQPSHAPFVAATAAALVAPTARRPGYAGRAYRAICAVLAIPGKVAAIRRDMTLLGRMDDRELADIGLCRQDLRDATGLPLGEHPGALLRQRVESRRPRLPHPWMR